MMLETLLSSRVRARILTAFFLSPGNPRNAWELAHSLKENYSAVWKELNRLERLGILSSEPKGNAKAYRVNRACPIEPELRSIIMKMEGINGILRQSLRAMGTVQKAFIYGPVATGKADRFSDIDLLVIGDIPLEDLSSTISEVERALSRPIHYVVFSEKVWSNKLAHADPFALSLENSAKILLVEEKDP